MLNLTGHAFKNYDDALEKLYKTIIEMGAKVDELAAMLSDALKSKDNLKDDAKILDKEVNSYEDQILSQVWEILAKFQPSIDELRFITSVIKFTTSLENMGDMGKIAIKRCGKLSNPVKNPVLGTLTAMIELTRKILKEAIAIMTDFDTSRVIDVTTLEGQINDLYSKLYKDMQQSMIENPENIAFLNQIQVIAKNIERMADHAFQLVKIDYFIHTGGKLKKKNLAG